MCELRALRMALIDRTLEVPTARCTDIYLRILLFPDLILPSVAEQCEQCEHKTHVCGSTVYGSIRKRKARHKCEARVGGSPVEGFAIDQWKRGL
jgi:hypothetical protein